MKKLILKKLILAAALSAFSFSAAAAHACDGMKGQEKSDTSSQAAKKDGKKSDGTTKTDQKS